MELNNLIDVVLRCIYIRDEKRSEYVFGVLVVGCIDADFLNEMLMLFPDLQDLSTSAPLETQHFRQAFDRHLSTFANVDQHLPTFGYMLAGFLPKFADTKFANI